jgi:hypothetical protein
VTELYVNPHRSQYATGSSYRTRTQGCTWTSAANGADASTGGRIDYTPDQVLRLVPASEETNPQTPGWSLGDVDKAMAKIGVPFEVRSGGGWSAVLEALADNLYVVLQGDSDVFSNSICSGAFDGDHCIGLHPKRNAAGQQRGNDPICFGARYYGRSVLERYAEKFRASVSFGVFTTPVPFVEQPHVVLTAPTPKEINVAITYAQPGRRLLLEKAQPLFRHPGGPRVSAMSSQTAVDFIGAAGAGWAAVRVRTRALYRDGQARPTVLYVPRKAGVLLS